MKKRYPSAVLLTAALMLAPSVQAGNAVDELLARYQAEGAQTTDAVRGEHLWKTPQGERSCQTCHGKDLTRPGSHQRTGKAIKPMAPSVNPERLMQTRKIEKWFLRNCKWTFGRECSAQEKADILVFLKKQ